MAENASNNVNSRSSGCSSTAYDQWRVWAQKQRAGPRKNCSNLVFEEEPIHEKVECHMQVTLGKRTRRSLLEDDDDDDDENNHQGFVTMFLPLLCSDASTTSKRKSNLEEGSDNVKVHSRHKKEASTISSSSRFNDIGISTNNDDDTLGMPPVTTLRRNDHYCEYRSVPAFPSLEEPSFSADTPLPPRRVSDAIYFAATTAKQTATAEAMEDRCRISLSSQQQLEHQSLLGQLSSCRFHDSGVARARGTA